MKSRIYFIDHNKKEMIVKKSRIIILGNYHIDKIFSDPNVSRNYISGLKYSYMKCYLTDDGSYERLTELPFYALQLKWHHIAKAKPSDLPSGRKKVQLI